MNRRLIVYLVSFAAFLGPFTQNIYTPIIPEVTREFHTSPFLVNLSISLFTLFMALMQFVYGPLTDSKGRRKVILFGISVYLLATLGCIFSHSIWILLFFRSLQAVGIASGSVVAATVIGDLFEGKDRGKAMGTFQTMVSLGPVMGPVIGGFLGGRLEFHSVFAALFAVGAIAGLGHFAFLKETKPVTGEASRFERGQFNSILKDRLGSSIILLGFVQNYASYNFVVFLPAILGDLYGLTAAQKGLAFLPMSLFVVIGSFAGGRLQGRMKGKKILLTTASLNILAIAGFLAVYPVSFLLLIIAVSLFGLFFGMSLPVQTTLLTQRFQANRATAIGVYNFSRYMGMAAGPIVGSLCLHIGGFHLVYGLAAAAFAGTALLLRRRLA